MAQRKLQHLVQSEMEFETASLRAALLLALPLFVSAAMIFFVVVKPTVSF
jgi:hypothetical protein